MGRCGRARVSTGGVGVDGARRERRRMAPRRPAVGKHGSSLAELHGAGVAGFDGASSVVAGEHGVSGCCWRAVAAQIRRRPPPTQLRAAAHLGMEDEIDRSPYHDALGERYLGALHAVDASPAGSRTGAPAPARDEKRAQLAASASSTARRRGEGRRRGPAAGVAVERRRRGTGRCWPPRLLPLRVHLLRELRCGERQRSSYRSTPSLSSPHKVATAIVLLITGHQTSSPPTDRPAKARKRERKKG
ncbi:hypothetical protein DAI22_04g084101 [Oryza sativa Japonica Group]|nr:hypothetical protein DAI22_04g084101 [Oryza sativa Japonica Group]